MRIVAQEARGRLRPETCAVSGFCHSIRPIRALRGGTLMTKWMITAALAALALTTSWAQAQEVKVGVALPYTGIGAEFAQLVDRGMELYLKLNADKVKPYKISLIKRDVKDPGGANAKIARSEERRVGKGSRSRWGEEQYKKKE